MLIVGQLCLWPTVGQEGDKQQAALCVHLVEHKSTILSTFITLVCVLCIGPLLSLLASCLRFQLQATVRPPAHHHTQATWWWAVELLVSTSVFG